MHVHVQKIELYVYNTRSSQHFTILNEFLHGCSEKKSYDF